MLMSYFLHTHRHDLLKGTDTLAWLFSNHSLSWSEAMFFFALWLKFIKKCLILHCKESELRLLLHSKKPKMAKMVNLRSNSVNDRSILKSHKKWWKMPKFKWDILSNFQTMWMRLFEERVIPHFTHAIQIWSWTWTKKIDQRRDIHFHLRQRGLTFHAWHSYPTLVFFS